MTITTYTPAYNFRNFQTTSPTSPLPAQYVDIELNAIKAALDSITTSLSSVRRSDGFVTNGAVTVESLSDAVITLIGSTGFSVEGVWVTTTEYAVGDLVSTGSPRKAYVCIEAHTSGTFATDLAADKWVAISVDPDAALSAYDNNTSGLTADDVQAAIDELAATAAAGWMAGDLKATGRPVAPSGWLLCYGQAVSRTTYADLFSALVIQQSGSTSSGAPEVTGLTDTSNMVAGMPVSGSGIPSSTTILSVDSATQITLSANATASATVTVTIAPWGEGDGSTTFNVPDLRGRSLTGRDNMGGSAASRVTSGSSAIAGTRVGATGGLQTLMAHTHTVATKDSGTAGTTAAVMEANAASDGTITSSSTGTGSSHGNMPPTAIVNWLIKT